MKKFFLAFSFLLSSSSFAANFHNLPNDLLTRAISSEIVYDEEFDYSKLGATSSLARNDNFKQYTPKDLVDHVIVNKATHQMHLLKDGQIIRSFWIALSDRPQGHKQFEGDRRTPEGTYTLDYIKERSNYYKAFHISYPNTKDILNARKIGKRPGGMIMVHGQPNYAGGVSVQSSDWTNGCIALLNNDLDIFFSFVDVGTPITIKP